MTIPNSFTAGTTAQSAQVNANFQSVYNQRSWNGDDVIGPGEYRKVYVHVDNATYGTRRVQLYLYGEHIIGTGAVYAHKHNMGSNGSSDQGEQGGSYAGVNLSNTPTHISVNEVRSITTVGSTSVPQGVKIYIDGVDKTSSIGNPNGKSASMYNSGTPSWGNLADNNWNTGVLDISSIISWTAGEHTIEFRETGSVGGRLLWSIYMD